EAAVPAAKPVPANSLGLAPGDLTKSPAPPAFEAVEAEPGDVQPLPPPYEGSPPVIPHAVADFLPITLEDNACIECHQVEEKIEGGPPPIPKSHYVDLRNSGSEPGKKLNGARYRCTACHAVRTNARPLVKNTFQAR
ncbi:MAG TPA: nitrate reductase cytochrome c-type subunit, partial [Candidatus Polarisedimenticolia bacterium]|nr:nitrate reductase cytochrome c-type subunit [Candidatus Polarisedimenticolia bacterium]